MFYCDVCRIRQMWPVGTVRSMGCCEVCGKPGTPCYDVSSTKLPSVKDLVDTMRKDVEGECERELNRYKEFRGAIYDLLVAEGSSGYGLDDYYIKEIGRIIEDRKKLRDRLINSVELPPPPKDDPPAPPADKKPAHVEDYMLFELIAVARNNQWTTAWTPTGRYPTIESAESAATAETYSIVPCLSPIRG